MHCDIRISVCIPTYNKADTIYYTINSVLNQTYENWEVIVVDDSDNDFTASVVERFFKHDQRIKYIKNKNRLGLVKNWNECIKHANYEYVYILHHDDFLMKSTLEKYNEFVKSNPQCGLIHSDCYYLSLPYFSKSIGKTQDVVILEKGDSAIEKVLFRNNIACSAVMVKKECYQRFGGFDENAWVSPDWEMWARIGKYYAIGHLDIFGCVVVRDNKNTHLSGIDVNEFDLQQIFYYKKIISYFSEDYKGKHEDVTAKAAMNLKVTLYGLGLTYAYSLNFGSSKEYLKKSGQYSVTEYVQILTKSLIYNLYKVMFKKKMSYSAAFSLCFN